MREVGGIRACRVTKILPEQKRASAGQHDDRCPRTRLCLCHGRRDLAAHRGVSPSMTRAG